MVDNYFSPPRHDAQRQRALTRATDVGGGVLVEHSIIQVDTNFLSALTDLFDDVTNTRAISPQSVSNNTAQVSEIIDTNSFANNEFVIGIGSLADSNATFTVLIEHGDIANLSDAAAAPDTVLLGTEVLASFQFDDDNETRKIGYDKTGTGAKRYIRMTITPAGNTSAAIFGAVCLQSNMANAFHDNIGDIRGLAPVLPTDNTAQVSQIIDTDGTNSTAFYFATGTLVDSNATFFLVVDEGDDSALGDATVVSQGIIKHDGNVGGAGTIVGSGQVFFQFDDDDETRKVTYFGKRRFVRVTITPTGNTSAAPMMAVCVQDTSTITTPERETLYGIMKQAIEDSAYQDTVLNAVTAASAPPDTLKEGQVGRLRCGPDGQLLVTSDTGASGLGKAEDSPHTSGDVGVMSLGVRNDNAATAFAGTTGDYSGMAVDSVGRQFITSAATTLTDNSGTIASGATAEDIAASNAARKGFYIQNNSTENMWFSTEATAVASQPSTKVAPGDFYETPVGGCSAGAISLISATTGSAFSSREW